MTFLTEIILKVSLLIVTIGGIFVGRRMKKIKDDSFVEEVTEEIIKSKTGLDIDLSPSSPEGQDGLQKVKEVSDLVEKQIDRI